ncbi:MAG: DUF502 domain-containing protein [Phycisphaerales bacterium]|nr:DUF502 domain-containing protein [Phycisphaerales bacterium]
MLRSHFKTLLSGIVALLPLAVTVAVLLWVGAAVHRLVGPQSYAGKFLSSIGLAVATDVFVGYLIGILAALMLAYAIGLVVKSRFRRQLKNATDKTLRRIPVIGPIYDLSSCFVGLLEPREESALRAMSPVWCFFGGEGGVVVLALMPAPEPIELNGQPYVAILVPTAPVPFGGGLLYVPASWVKPAGFGMDRLTSVYVSMGVVPPTAMGAASA